MKNIFFALSCFMILVSMAACKDKNAKSSEGPEMTSLPYPGASPTDPRSIASKLENATSAVADEKALEWAGNMDPVCNMKVDQTAEDTVHYQGKIYGFCSESCKESFQADPKKWTSKLPNQ